MRTIIYTTEQKKTWISDWGMHKEVSAFLQLRVQGAVMGIHVFVAPPEAPVLIQRIGYWGTMTPQDPFALYRTVLMMERISMISGFNLNRAHTAVSRHPIGPFANRYLSDIQKMVGPGVHEEIMSTQIQGDVIAFLLSMPDELATQMGHLVVSELDAGTLVWRPAYARFGIEPVGIS